MRAIFYLLSAYAAFAVAVVVALCAWDHLSDSYVLDEYEYTLT